MRIGRLPVGAGVAALVAVGAAFASEPVAPRDGAASPAAEDTDVAWVDPGLPGGAGDGEARVVGGKDVKEGRWPDVALVWPVGCTGTLIHPQWVLTAGHCVVGASVDSVVVGLTSYSELGERGTDAETREVRRAVPHPRYERRQWGYDIALLRLDKPIETIAPRLIGTDCVVDADLVEGEKVTIVGWGTVNAAGTAGTSELQEGRTEVQTPDCAEDRVDGMASGCDPEARPGGEMGAGGNGVDACFGDSGGPLYLASGGVDYLVGVTSRAYWGVPPSEPCGYGGIYTRPDAVMDWIEETIGESLPRPVCTESPTASAEVVRVGRGASRDVRLDAADPDGEVVAYELVTPPAFGTVTIDGLDVTYEAFDDAEGTDSFTLRVLDDGSAAYPDAAPGSVDVVVPVEIRAGCGGCASGAGISGPWGGLLAAGVLWARRRARAA